MRRAAVLCAQLAQRSGSQGAGSALQLQAPLASTSLLAVVGNTLPGRSFASGPGHGAPHPAITPNPLQQIVPEIIKYVKIGSSAVLAGPGMIYNSLITSGAAKSTVTYLADEAVLSERFLALKDVDLPALAAFMADGGYSNSAGWRKLVVAAKATAPSYTPAQVSTFVEALQKAEVYDKELYSLFASIIKDKFTEFETAGLAKIAHSYAANDHFELDLFDDIADSIAYANHYMAPLNVPIADIANVFAAYAKYEHDRADLFVVLARAIFEDRLKALNSKSLNHVVMTLLRAFNKLEFWPDATQALFVAATKTHAEAFPAEQAEIDGYITKVASYSGGDLAWLNGGYKDFEHFEGHPFGDYNLYVFRDDLSPQYYKPTDVKIFK